MPDFYPSTFAYSHFSSKIQFLNCLLSSLSLWGIPMVGTWVLGYLKFRSPDCQKLYFWYFCRRIACTLLINMIFPWILVQNISILLCLFKWYNICSGSSSCWNFRVLWGDWEKSWRERSIKLSFMPVCKYLNQRLREIGE